MKPIAFITNGAFSHINARVREQLERQFPGHPIVAIDIAGEFVGRRPWLNLRNLPDLLQMHGPGILLQRKRYLDIFDQTPFLYHEVRRRLRARLQPLASDLAFTFQTASVFDASLPGIPHFVYTDHTHLTNLSYPGFDRKNLLPRSWTDLERETYQHATRNLTMSGHVRRSMIEDYGVAPERVVCVYAGSNTGGEALRLENDGYGNQNILFVGIDWERKGGPQLLRAFEIVRAKYPGARLTLVGAAPKVILSNCQVLGPLPLEEVRRQYARASIFCLPTRIEPFGIAPLEAMMQKLPVVVTRVGALPDFVQDGVNGRLVPPDDVGALAGALMELLGAPEVCRRFGEAGHALVSERYHWEAVGRRIRQVIQSVVPEHLGALATA